MTALVARVTDVSRAWQAATWYVILTLVVTWPLAPNIRHDFPGDLGDPLFVSWAIARAADHWLALLSGDGGAITRFWQAGIFHPEPLATAFSEHFIAHALQILPVWALTRDIILCYNLLFLATYVVGGIGMYLLARELTGSARGAFVAGLLVMFTPSRLAVAAHLQVLSSQWMPLAFYGLRRYFGSGRRGALAGGAAAIFLQNLSSGYYLIYFAPFVGLYTVGEMWARGLLGRWRVWRDVAIVGAVTLACTLPFALPYMALQQRFHYRRPLAEIQQYSADLLAWLTASPNLTVWAWLQTWPQPEAALFPGLTIVVLAVAGGLVARHPMTDPERNPTRAVMMLIGLATVLGVWMASGPSPRAAGHVLPIPALYTWFYNYVPGFDVSRVPARFSTIVVLFLAMAASYGTAWLDRTGRRRWLAAAAVAAVLDGAAWPLTRNAVFWTSDDVRRPEGRVYAEKNAPAIFHFLETLPPDAVLAHLPFGYPEYELRYMFYASAEGYHRMVNGYSGAFPGSYVARTNLLQRSALSPGPAVDSLQRAGVTHVVVHTEHWADDTGARTVNALTAAGLTPITRVGPVVVLRMP